MGNVTEAVLRIPWNNFEKAIFFCDLTWFHMTWDVDGGVKVRRELILKRKSKVDVIIVFQDCFHQGGKQEEGHVFVLRLHIDVAAKWRHLNAHFWAASLVLVCMTDLFCTMGMGSWISAKIYGDIFWMVYLFAPERWMSQQKILDTFGREMDWFWYKNTKKGIFWQFFWHSDRTIAEQYTQERQQQ